MEVWQFFSMVCTIAVSYYFFHKDVKSEMTKKLPVYKMKKKMMVAFFGIEINEV